MLNPIKRRVMGIIGRAVLQAVYDADGRQRVKIGVLKDETLDKVERFQEYGLATRPKEGAEALVVFLGGNRDHGIVACIDDRRYRLKPLEEGEVALYTDEGDYIHFKRNNKIEIKTKELKILAEDKLEFSAPEIAFTAETSMQLTAPEWTVSSDEALIDTTHFDVVAPATTLLSLIGDTITEAINGVVATAMGPQKLIGAQFPALKTKADNIKG